MMLMAASAVRGGCCLVGDKEGTRIGVSVSLPPFSCPLIGEIGGFRRGEIGGFRRSEIAVQKNNGKIFAA